jgi:hypothetical protein
MSIEYTGINKDTAAGEFTNFLESFPEGTIFKMVINSKRGYLRVKIKNVNKSKFKKWIVKLRIRRQKLFKHGKPTNIV